MKRYLSLSDYLKLVFGEKVAKLSLDGGFTCPNRDGKISYKGCIFCTESGSGEFAGNFVNHSKSIEKQIEFQKTLMRKKWRVNKFISYFQNFTGTYGELQKLELIYESAINDPEVVGLAISTRADCLSEDVLSLLSKINKRTFLWLEVGMQTIKDSTLSLINRGYNHELFNDSVIKLQNLGIKFVVHLIFGLPFESRDDMLASIDYVCGLKPFGLKIHSLYIDRNSELLKFYNQNPFHILSREEYVNLVADSIERLPKNIVVHRLTGDPNPNTLFAPLWTKDKLAVLSSIERELKIRNLPLIEIEKIIKEM